MTAANRICLVAGTAAPDHAGGARIVRWDCFEQSDDEWSLPRAVAEDWRGRRAEYVRWIEASGTPALREGLRVGDGPSVWWMTLMAEKSPMKSRTIYLVMKLRALELLCEDGDIREIECRIGESRARRVIADWCARTGRKFTGTGKAADGATETAGKRLRFLPHGLRGVLWLLWRWWTRARPARAKPSRPPAAPGLAIATYFPNCDMEKLRNGDFRSAYWRGLHDLIARRADPVLWVWLYAPSDALNFRESITCRDRCNERANDQNFMLAEEVVSPRVALRALGLFLVLWRRSLALMRHCGEAPMEGSRLALRPVLEEDWRASLRGVVAAEAAWYIAMFGALAEAATPKTGLYLFENQNWEAALVHAWRQRGVPRIIAHQHEAIKPLNLRLFDTPAALDAKPAADRLAVGSEHAITLLRDGGWPEERLSPVESLRFRNAGGGPAPAGGDALLVIAGYLEGETRTLLDIAARASGGLSETRVSKIVIKPHPFLPVEDRVAALDFALPVEISNEPLDALWGRAGLVFAANSTAAVFDAMAAGLPVTVCAPDDDLNLSPALGQDNVPLTGSADELVRAARQPPATAPPPAFLESPDLKRWEALLDETP